MPRPRPSSSALKTPLDFILGSQGAVRVLRVLCATDVPLSQSELSRRASLSLSGLPSLLATLESANVISWVGRGRTRQVQISPRFQLVQSLRQLFSEETARWRRIESRLRELVGAMGEGIIASWIEGPVAEDRDTFSDALIVAILSEQSIPVSVQEGLRKQLNQLQATERIIVDLRFHNRADLLRFSESKRNALVKAIPLYGPAVIDLMDQVTLASGSPTGKKATKQTTARGRLSPRAIANRIAERLLREPELLEATREHIKRRLFLASSSERLALLEWQGLLETLTPGQIAAILREDSERADALRQNLPFVSSLTGEERARMFSTKEP